MTELEYLIKHGGLAPKRLLKRITWRGFVVSVLGGLATAAASRLIGSRSAAAAGPGFTIAIIPDPQFLAESCPDSLGEYYAAMMTWIVDHKNIVLASSPPSFNANIKAVVGVGDCVNSTVGTNEYTNAETAWRILDRNGIAFTTPPGASPFPQCTSGMRSASVQFQQTPSEFVSL